ncbi:ribonuclease H2, subunit C [Hygrophoropsis aurantiaca]|uniref:Ribonuclease H2, subunit C n=1 Tax=Hygrophoropsis aurantiaca TaxID=72124 RepID=A0ACB8ACR4_9AGAM|nr:ribonuclease H2, subunit C [Hygrophoropsis aurantiaca]
MEIASFDTTQPRECSPNLMPFHISYSGPAPISRYFRVRPAPASLAFGTNGPSTSTSTIIEDDSNRAVEAKKSHVDVTLSTKTTQEVPPLASEESQESLASIETTMIVDEATIPTAGNSSGSISTLVDHSIDAQVPEKDSKGGRTQGFVATFRGREVRGQAVELPKGYGGIVLQAPKFGTGKSVGGGKEWDDDKKKESRSLRKPKSKPKSKGRSARNSAKVIDVDDEGDEAMEGNADSDNNGDLKEADGSFLETDIRTLKPTSIFSSFVLWTPDIPVDDGKDEYLRSLTEWTRLAVEIHSCEDEESGT